MDNLWKCVEHRWLNEFDESCPLCDVVLVERERIINLLKNPKCKPNDHDYNGGCNCDVIALIKGENK